MKKMMIFAVMMSMLLAPAQMMARNNRDSARPGVENRVRKNDRKEAKMKFDNARPGKPGKQKFDKREKERRPMPPVARRHRRPMQRPLPPPPPPRYHHHHHHHCDNGAAETAATIISLAALISAIAD